MTSYSSFIDFANLLNNNIDNINKNDIIYNIKELYDSNTKHLIVRKYNVDDIKVQRMLAVINNYIDFYGNNENCDRKKLEIEYKNNIIDNISNKLNPPECFFTRSRRDYLDYEHKNKVENDNCDINNHYYNINKKYEYYNNLVKKSDVTEEEINEYYNQEDNYEEDYVSCSCNSEDYYYENDILSDNDSDYYSDELY